MLNTKGAAKLLGCTENWIHKLVYTARIKAYTYDEEGKLVEHEAHTHRQGQGLYFHERDINAYKNKRRGAGRPPSSKGKKSTSKRDENVA